MTAIFRLLPWPDGPGRRSPRPQDTPAGTLVPFPALRRPSIQSFDLAAMTQREAILLAYVVRGKPLTDQELRTLVQICRRSTPGVTP